MGRRTVLAAAVFLAVSSSLISSGCGGPARTSIHERFRKGPDGVITDLFTGLQWRVGPDRDFDRYGAEIWISGLEGDWRMPTYDELKELSRAGVTTETWGPFDNSGWLVWCVDYTSRDMMNLFCFEPSNVYAIYHCAGQRVFAVLSPGGYGAVAFSSSETSPAYIPQLEPILFSLVSPMLSTVSNPAF